MVKIFRGCSLAAPFLFLEPYWTNHDFSIT